MANTIRLRRSSTAGAVPTTSQLSLGELAINTTDGKMYLKKDVSGTESIVQIGGSVTIASSPPSGASPGDIYWDDTDVQAFIYYDDGDTSQWVPLTPNASGQLGGTVTSIDVSGGTGLTSSGGPITTNGTITLNLDDTAVTAGSYTAADITIDAQGRITAAANGNTLTQGDSSIEVTDTGSDGTITLKTENTSRVTVDSSGNVGIGITSPTSHNSIDRLLNIDTASGTKAGISLSEAGANYFDIYFDGSNNTAHIDQSASGGLVFTSGSNEAIRIDSLGYLGIGTSTAAGKLHIKDDGYRKGIVLERGGSTADRGFIYIGDGTNSTIVDEIYLDAHNTAFHFRQGSTGTTETVTFLNNGNVGIGSTSPNAKLEIGGLPNSGTNEAFTIQRSDGTELLGIFWIQSGNDVRFSSNTKNIQFTNTGTDATTFEIASSGIVATPYTYSSTTTNSANVHIASNGTLARSTSSIKYKTNVETLEDSYADAILNCRPVWYQSTTGNDNPDWGHWGFIAEEVAEVDPRLVFWKTTELIDDVETPCEPEVEGVQYDRFVPHLLNLIKRQKEQIESLEARITTLEAGS